MTVKGPIIHSAHTIERNFDVQLGRWIYSAVDVYEVGDLADGSARQEVTALARALAASGLPQPGHPYAGQPGQLGCVVTGYRSISIPQATDACNMAVIYTTPVPQGPLLPAVVINTERDTVVSREPTFFHPNGTQLLVQPPKSAGRSTPPYALPATRFLSLTRLTITAAVTLKNFSAVENAVNCVNSANWMGYGKGFWRFDHYRELSTNANQIVEVDCEFLTMRERPWLEFADFRYEGFHSKPTIDAKILKNALKMPYFYGQTQLQGLTVIGWHEMKSFRSIFGV